MIETTGKSGLDGSWRKLREIFAAAVELPDGERSGFLEREVGGDAALRKEVEALLAEHRGLGSFLEPSDQDLDDELPADRRIASYTLISVLGRGGMGTVYLAEQDDPARKVALKVIASPRPSARSLRRFELEARILARLVHPGIAQIYATGTARLGDRLAPWIAMELVLGTNVLEHARARGLGTRERIDLFVRICEAVQHAHEKSVIHRDLKPENVLVDASGQPKVLDFGVARASDPELRLTTISSDARLLVGTLPYMSPEQVGGADEDVDTRSDVYSLGVLLYELLAGRLPHDLDRLNFPEALRVIAQDPPARLSTTDRRLRGDLETIAMKALEKDRDRRYATAGELAADLRRFLAEQPIRARPASTAYQLSKFARRNKALVAGVCAAFLALLAGTIGTTMGMVEARESGLLAEKRRDQAAKSLAKAREVQGLLQEMLERVRPEVALGRDTSLFRAMLDDTSRRLDEEFRGDPGVEAAVRMTVGWSYDTLGLHAEGEMHLRRALELYRAAAETSDADLVLTLIRLSAVLMHVDRYDEAEELAREALEIGERSGGADTLESAHLQGNLAVLLAAQRRFQEAEPMFRRCLAVLTREGRVASAEAARFQEGYSDLLRQSKRWGEAEPLAEAALETRIRLHGRIHPDVLTSLQRLTALHYVRGDYEQAARAGRETLSLARELFAEDHPSLAVELGNLGKMQAKRGENEEAETLLRECIERNRRAGTTALSRHAGALATLASVLRGKGELDESDALFREALAVLREGHEQAVWIRYEALTGFAELARERGELVDALAAMEESIPVGESVLASGDPRLESSCAWIESVRGDLRRVR